MKESNALIKFDRVVQSYLIHDHLIDNIQLDIKIPMLINLPFHYTSPFNM